jgi:cytochrome c556
MVLVSIQQDGGAMFKNLTVLSAALIGLAFSQDNTTGVSGGLSGLDAIAARQAGLDMSSITFRSMGDAMKAGREAKTQGYAAMVLAKWAKTLPRMFPPGTAQGETSVFSQALPLIWRDRANFDTAAANYAAATAKLSALAAANDTAGFTTQLEEVNQACGLCHARFKAGDQGPPKK